MFWHVCVLALLSLITPGYGHDRTVKRGGTVVVINTHSGSLLVSKMEDAPKDDQHAVNVTFIKFSEKDATGSPIGDHCFDFVSSQLRGAYYNFTEENSDNEVYTVPAVYKGYAYQIADVESSPFGDVNIVKEAKQLDILGENVNVEDGDVIFDFNIPAWDFCGCYQGGQERVGAFLELVVKVEGANTLPKAEMNTSTAILRRYDMGEGGIFMIPTKFKRGANTVVFPNGYPSVEGGGDVTFRVPAADFGDVRFTFIIKPSTAMLRPTEAPIEVPSCPPPTKTGSTGDHKIDLNLHLMSHVMFNSAIKATNAYTLLFLVTIGAWKWIL